MVRPGSLRPLASFRLCQRSLSTLPALPAFAFDIDGVLKQGDRVMGEAVEALRILRGDNRLKKEYPFILVTNGGGTTEEERAKKLTHELGVSITPTILVQSHTIYRSLAPKYVNSPVLVLGDRRDQDNCRRVAESYGFNQVYIADDLLHWNPSIWPFSKVCSNPTHVKTDVDFSQVKFAAVLVLSDSRDVGRDIQLVTDLLIGDQGVFGTVRERTHESDEAWTKEDQLPVYFSNPDLLWGNSYPLSRFGAGMFQTSLAAVYQETTGRELFRSVGGKPSKATYDYAAKLLSSLVGDRGLGRVYMVGDNPASDIAGANAYGWESCLVRTGVFRGKGNDLQHPATVVVDNVLEAVKFALAREGEDII